MHDLPPQALFERLNRQFQRVGTGMDALAEALRERFGGPDPRVALPSGDLAINVDLAILRIALSVLESLPDNAGKARFLEGMTAAINRALHGDAGA